MRVLLGVAVGMFVLGACGGKTTEESDLVISESESALVGGPEEDDGDRADDGCRDGDRDGHHRHRRHWFKVLDAVDGAKDGNITIGSLPGALPDRLIAKLQRIDRNGDGIVTRREVKAWRRHRQADDRNGDDRNVEEERDDD